MSDLGPKEVVKRRLFVGGILAALVWALQRLGHRIDKQYDERLEAEKRGDRPSREADAQDPHP